MWGWARWTSSPLHAESWCRPVSAAASGAAGDREGACASRAGIPPPAANGACRRSVHCVATRPRAAVYLGLAVFPVPSAGMDTAARAEHARPAHGVLNRRPPAGIGAASPGPTVVGLHLIDIDHFKHYNDRTATRACRRAVKRAAPHRQCAGGVVRLWATIPDRARRHEAPRIAWPAASGSPPSAPPRRLLSLGTRLPDEPLAKR